MHCQSDQSGQILWYMSDWASKWQCRNQNSILPCFCFLIFFSETCCCLTHFWDRIHAAYFTKASKERSYYSPRHLHSVQVLFHPSFCLLQHAPPSQLHPALLFSSLQKLSEAFAGNTQAKIQNKSFRS